MMMRTHHEATMAHRQVPVMWMLLLLWATVIVTLSSSAAQAAGSGGSSRMGPVSVPASTLMAPSDGGLVGSDFSSQLDSSAEAACDPRIQSCQPPDGGGGGGGGSNGDCPKWKQDLSLCKPDDGGGGTCGPGPGGPPDQCSTGPTNSPGGAGGSVNVGGGNPVNLITGNKYQTEVDLPALPGVLGLEVTRHYNAMGRYNGLTGSGWRTSYEAVLYDFGSLIQITQADGRRVTFDRVADFGHAAHGTLCTASQPQDGQVTIHPRADGKNEYRWRWTDGRVLSFSDGSGGGYPLQSIRAASGEMLSLTYAPKGELVRVRDPQGRSLDFVYDKQVRLQAIVTPVSRIEYTIDASGRLTQVAIKPRQDRPAAQSRPNIRRYHYEDRYNAGWKNVLTGIGAVVFDDKGQASEQRLSTYAYDAQGRANLSTKGRPREMVKGQQTAGTGIEQIDLKYEDITAPAEIARLTANLKDARPRLLSRTTLTNATGQTTEIISAIIGGHHRLLSMKGPGCSTCGPSNRAYAYDAAGRLLKTTRLDTKGQPTRSNYERHDAYGRLVETGLQASANDPAHWQMRYRYRDVKFKDGSIALGQQPIVIARPSVVPGRQALTLLEYNDRGQLLKATDEAWSPVDAGGQPSDDPARATAIRRSTTFIYTTIDGRSVLKRIDGPLPNGPASSPQDSDITDVAWNDRGDRITQVAYPLNQTAHLAYDAATGWPIEVTGPSGGSDHIEYNLNGQPTHVRRVEGGKGGRVTLEQRWQHDAFGRLIQASRVIDGQERGEVFNQYDIAGRLLMQASAQGVLNSVRYDAEGRLLASTMTSATQSQQERYGYDESGRLVTVEDSTGAKRRIVRDDQGHVVGSVDPLGRLTQYQPGRSATEVALNVLEAANTGQPRLMNAQLNGQGRLSEVSLQADDGKGQVRRNATRIVHDDFGRIVAIQSDDTGLTLHRYDAAGQRIWSRDGKGIVTEIQYDAAGRVIRRRTGGSEAQTVTYRYDGARLVEVQDAVQLEQLHHDATGRLIARVITLTPPKADGIAPTPISAAMTYRYNDRSELIAQGLPDGSEVQFERNAQGQVVAIHHQRLPALDLGWTRRTLASGLLRDATGKNRFSYGNGVEASWQRSEQGVLARVLYRALAKPPATGLRAMIESWIKPAQAAPPAGQAVTAAQAASAPGALSAPDDPRALYDSRLLYDASGNVVLVRDAGAVVSPGQAQQTHYTYDGLNQLVQAWQDTLPANNESGPSMVKVSATDRPTALWRYHQDGLGNRLIAQSAQQGQVQSPLLKMAYKPDSSELAEPDRDPKRQDRRWRWNADGTLAAALQTTGAGEQQIASYHYNHQGLRVVKTVTPPDGSPRREYTLYDTQRNRIADLDAQGRITRQYVWIDDLLIAVINAKEPAAPASVDPGSAQASALSSVWGALLRSSRIAYVHSNHLGAPVAVTDDNAKPIWRASYSPYGQRLNDGATPNNFNLALRLPGQWEDPETGLHYNDQRYYDSAIGRYISADPLGLDGGFNAHAYVANNPLGYTDPLGLVLFAFDGTGNTNDTDVLRETGSSESNVWQFRQLYQDGNRRYITGVGMVHADQQYGDIVPKTYSQGTRLGIIPGVSYEEADMGGNYSGPARVQRMLQYFNDEADLETDDEKVMLVDVIGFSRGAAQARSFSNTINAATKDGWYQYKGSDGAQRCQKVEFRFMGLWDTVLSTNYSGVGYNLGIPETFTYVAHAVALNEHRGKTLRRLPKSPGGFPLESIQQGMFSPVPVPGKTRIERGFIGAHADVGGGFGEGENQLARVARDWMLQQAKAAGLNMQQVSSTVPANPVIHDKSDNQYCLNGVPCSDGEDREVHYGNGSKTTQRDMIAAAGMAWSDTQGGDPKFIDYLPSKPNRLGTLVRVPRADFVTGTVNMQSYLKWLRENGYDLGNLQVQ